MKKGYIITAVVVLLAVLVLVGVFLRDDFRIISGEDGTTAPSAIATDSDGYVMMVKGSVDNTEPMMKTDIADLYYTMARDGSVAFYRIEGTQIVQVPESGTFDVTVNCTDQEIPATVHYYTAEDGTVAGYGLFTTENSNAEVYIYDYAFFRMMNLPDAYAEDGAYLLLIDTTKEDFYSNDKVFEENFIFRTESGETETILSTDNRAYDNTGAARADYAMLTEDAVLRCGENFLFFSARQYHLYTVDKNMDIYMAGGSGNNRDNNRYIQDVVDFYLNFDEDGRVVCLKRNGENAFRIIAYADGTENVVKDFEGNYHEEYLRSGDWLLNKKTLEMYNIMTAQTFTLSVENTNGFTPDLFVTDGSNVFLRGLSDGKAAIVLGKTDGACGCYYNDMFARVFAPAILSDGSVVVSVAADMEGSSYSVKIFSTEQQAATEDKN